MQDRKRTIYRAALVLMDLQFESEVALVEQNGEIDEILRGPEAARTPDPGDRVVDLGNVAVIPGQINVHSHAFQRSLRGRTESRQQGVDDFWSWRAGMYELANRIEPGELEIIGEMIFMEMLRAGITHVGEFHYLHHRRDGTPYDDRNEMILRLGRAARKVGIRLTGLPVLYGTGGIGEPAGVEQRRFLSPNVESYLAQVDELVERWDDETLFGVAMAPHSIRAVPRDWLEELARGARKRQMAVHIHVCEQRKEIMASRQAYGMPPVEALHQWGLLDETWTLIHCTHLSDRELEILEEIRPTVGACPTTERNLGDGFLPGVELIRRDVPIGLGSDSHTVVDPFEEMRLVEYHERLRGEERNVLVAADRRGRPSTAEVLWPMGTTHGARSLSCRGGVIAEGEPADLVALDLDHPSIAGATTATLLSDVVLSMSSGAVRDVIVAGRPVVAERRHRREREIVDQYVELMERYGAPEVNEMGTTNE